MTIADFQVGKEEQIIEIEEQIIQTTQEFEKLVQEKRLGDAVRLVKEFTYELEILNEILSHELSVEELFLLIYRVNRPLEIWRAFLDEYCYFDDISLMKNWIQTERDFFKKKRDFEGKRRDVFEELDFLERTIRIYMKYYDFINADEKWVRAKELLTDVFEVKLKEKWKLFEEEYLRWKNAYIEESKIDKADDLEKLKMLIETLVEESLISLNKGKLNNSFEKQSKIVNLLDYQLKKKILDHI